MAQTTFKLRLTKRYNNEGWEDKLNKKMGLYEQLKGGNKVTYNKTKFSLKMFEDAFSDLYNKKKQDEYRKEFSFRSKIFKQTYKFG